jgi:hypothetical protein
LTKNQKKNQQRRIKAKEAKEAGFERPKGQLPRSTETLSVPGGTGISSSEKKLSLVQKKNRKEREYLKAAPKSWGL